MNLVNIIKSHDDKTISKCKLILIAGILIGSIVTAYEIYECKKEITIVERPDSNKGNIENLYDLFIDGEKEKVSIEIEAKEASKKQNKANVRQAITEIDSSIFSNSESANKVDGDLIIKDSYVDGLVDASWSFDRYDLVGSNGQLRWDNIKSNEIVEANVTLTCNDYSENYSFFFNICLPDKDTKEGIIYYLKEEIQNQSNDKERKNSVALPDHFMEKSLVWKKSFSGTGVKIVGLTIIVIIAIMVGEQEEKNKEKKEYQKNLELDYPKILGSLSLYVSAGVSVKNSFGKIAEDYLKKGIKSPGYELIVRTINSMNDGKNELAAYEEMGKISKNKNYRRLSLILSQSIRKGTSGLVGQLEKEEQEAFNIRKLNAKIAGEEASTKLLFPMMGLLGIVLVILVVPAVLGMKF